MSTVLRTPLCRKSTGGHVFKLGYGAPRAAPIPPCPHPLPSRGGAPVASRAWAHGGGRVGAWSPPLFVNHNLSR